MYQFFPVLQIYFVQVILLPEEFTALAYILCGIVEMPGYDTSQRFNGLPEFLTYMLLLVIDSSVRERLFFLFRLQTRKEYSR